LVELLVVIAIISILAGLLLPALSRAMEQARSIQCMNQQRQMGVGMNTYASEHEDSLTVPVFSWNGATPHPSYSAEAYTMSANIYGGSVEMRGLGIYQYHGYLEDWNLFYCPARGNSEDKYAINYGESGPATWHHMYREKWQAFAATGSTSSVGKGGINPGYSIATSGRWYWNGALAMDAGRVNNFSRARPGKVLVWEPCWFDGSTGPMGLRYQDHGNYAFVTYDLAARSFQDTDGIEFSRYFRNPSSPNPGTSRAHHFNTNPDNHALAYIQRVVVGWDDYTYKKSLVLHGWSP
jgi:hypothetical protein